MAKMTTESASSSSSSMLKADLPCPRLCGASFAPNGRLVYFSNVGINFSVRTFSKLRETLAGGAAQYIRGSPSLNDGEEPSNVIQPTVTSYNMVNIAPLSLELATSYKLSGSLSSPASVRSLCLHNAEVASRAGARAIARAWNSLAAISQACETGAIPATHALARGLVKEIRRKMISPPFFLVLFRFIKFLIILSMLAIFKQLQSCRECCCRLQSVLMLLLLLLWWRQWLTRLSSRCEQKGRWPLLVLARCPMPVRHPTRLRLQPRTRQSIRIVFGQSDCFKKTRIVRLAPKVRQSLFSQLQLRLQT